MKKLSRKTKSVVGLDIGSHSVKLVHLEHGNEGRRLLCGLEQEYLPVEGEEQDAVVAAIRSVFQRADLKIGHNEDVITSVNGSGTAIKQVEFPLLTKEELESSIKWEAGKRLPFGPDEAVFDYQIISRDEEAEKMSVLLAAVTKTHLAEHLQLLEKVGLQPPIIDLSPLAVANALQMTHELAEDEAVALLDMGASKTILNAFSPGSLFFSRDISVSGNMMTAEIQKQRGVDLEEAERIKCEGKGKQLLENLKKPLDQFLFEIRRSLTFYENRRGNGGFAKLYLAGGGAHLRDLAEHLHTRLGVPIEEFNPLQGMELGEAGEELSAIAPRLALATGLALREVGK